MTDSDVYGRIIWSADVPGNAALLTKLDQIGLPIGVKIDRLYARRYGDDIFHELRDRGINVFNDAKLVEIPSKLEELAKTEVERTHPWMLNCMAGAVSNGQEKADDRDKLDGLKRFADICLTARVLPCAVTVLTSKSEGAVEEEFNGRTPIEQVLYYVKLLLEFGFTDLVCSPREAVAIRDFPEFDGINLNTPGVRMPGNAAGDQARVATPGEAAGFGVNRVVIGRPITGADDPRAAVEAIADDMRSAA